MFILKRGKCLVTGIPSGSYGFELLENKATLSFGSFQQKKELFVCLFV